MVSSSQVIKNKPTKKDLDLIKDIEEELDEWLKTNVKEFNKEYYYPFKLSKLYQLTPELRYIILDMYKKNGWAIEFKLGIGWMEIEVVITAFKN